jgi:hypothetical protein
MARQALGEVAVGATGKRLAPSVTFWYSRTRSPMMAVSPMTTPVPWSMKKPGPMVAPGWMSMPVRLCATSATMRASSGRPSSYSRCARRWWIMACTPG